MKKANIQLNRKMLARAGVDPASFSKAAELAMGLLMR